MPNSPDNKKNDEEKAGKKTKKSHHSDAERSDKADKKDKKHHHHHRHHSDKPTGPAPLPPAARSVSLTEKIVTDMHATAAPIPTAPARPKEITPKVAPVETIKNKTADVPVEAKASNVEVKLGLLPRMLNWLKVTILRPTFARQKQTTMPYSLHFLATLNAIQKRLSANDETQASDEKLVAHTALKFSGKTEKATANSVTVLDLSANTTNKPTLH